MYVAALCSGGKDSAYALWLAMKLGHEIRELITIIPEREDSWMYHTANIDLIDLFSECAGIPVRKVPIKGVDGNERLALKMALEESGTNGVVSGVIASSYQKNAIDKTCAELGITSMAPLWGRDPSELLREIAGSGFEIIITLVAAEGLGPKWLGRKIDGECIRDLERASEKYGVNVSGEGGEYETLVTDAPFFRRRIEVLDSRKLWDEKAGRGVYQITGAITVEK